MAVSLSNITDKIKDKKKLVMIIFIASVVIYLDFKFVLGPQLGIIGNIGPHIKQLRQDIQSVKRDLAIFNDLNNRWESLKKKTASYANLIISPDYIPGLLQEISNFARSLDIKIMQIRAIRNQAEKPVAEIEQSQYYSLAISLEIRASYQSLVAFLNKLETAPRFMRVVTCDITPNSEGHSRHQIKLTLETYIIVKG